MWARALFLVHFWRREASEDMAITMTRLIFAVSQWDSCMHKETLICDIDIFNGLCTQQVDYTHAHKSSAALTLFSQFGQNWAVGLVCVPSANVLVRQSAWPTLHGGNDLHRLGDEIGRRDLGVYILYRS